MRNVRFLSVITAAMFGMYSFAFGQQADTTFSVTVEGNVGIGTTSPAGRLEVIGDGTSNPAIIAKNEGNSNSHPYIRAIGASEQQTTRPIFDGRRSRGTIVNPTDVAPDDRILSLLGNPYIDGTYRSNVSIEMFVGEAPGINSYPALYINNSDFYHLNKYLLNSQSRSSQPRG